MTWRILLHRAKLGCKKSGVNFLVAIGDNLQFSLLSIIDTGLKVDVWMESQLWFSTTVFRPRSWKRMNHPVIVILVFVEDFHPIHPNSFLLKPHNITGVSVCSESVHVYPLSPANRPAKRACYQTESPKSMRANPHRTRRIPRTQIGMFFLWYCLRAVWTPLFTSTGPICWCHIARRILRPV